MRIFEWAIINSFQMMHDDYWIFNSMDTKIDCPTFRT